MRIVKRYACGALLLSVGLASAALAATFPPGSQGPTLPPSAIPRIDPRLSPPPSPCTITAITPTSGPGNMTAVVTGQNMDQQCVILFDISGGTSPAYQYSATPNAVKVRVPNYPPGRVAKVSAWKNGEAPRTDKYVTFNLTASRSDDCISTAVNPPSAPSAAYIAITGTRLDQACGVELLAADGNVHRLAIFPDNAGQLRTQIFNNIALGLGQLRIFALNPEGKPILPGRTFPFTVGSTGPAPLAGVCQITGITPNSAPQGSVVTVIGNAMNQNCQVEFSGTGRQIAQVEGMPTATQIRVYVPVVSGPGGQATVTAFKAGMQPDRTKSVAFTFTGEDCAVTASTPNTATWNEAFTLTGTRLDQNCMVDFKPDVGNPVPLQPSFQNAGQIKAQLPLYTPLGHGRVRIYPRGTSGPPAGGTSLDFMVKSPRPDAGPCETFLAQPQSGNPGTEVILWGNSIMNQGCTVEFIHLPQFGGDLPATYPAQPQGLDANHLKVKVPMMPAGTAVVVSRAGQTNTAKVNAGFTVNEVAPVLNSVAPTSGYRGDNVALSGLAFLPPVAGQEYVHAQHEDLRVVLQVGSKKFEVVPTHANNPLTAGDDLVVKLPDIFAGMTNVPTAGVLGSISVYRRVPSLSSSAVPFTFKPATGQAASTQATPASPNNAGAAKPGYRYVGTPACPSIFGKILVPNVDASGYYCCAQESAVRGGRCGDFWQEYQATCATIANCPTAGAGGGCDVNLFREGCYKPQ